jgi:hypothetical protein
MNKTLTPKSSHIQLVFLGFVALTIGIVCMLDVIFVYQLPALTSISESATTGNKAGMLLPFALGCMFTYCIAYVGYCRSERILTRIMAIGFAVVALQICDSIYVTVDRVGLLGLSPQTSHILHTIAAVIGFGAMFIWVAFYFTRGVANPTPEKRTRNRIYLVCATFMASGIILFILGMFGLIGAHSVFIAEEFLLIPAGFASIVKGGFLFEDKKHPFRQRRR